MEKILTAVCRHVRNYFVKTVDKGDFTIGGGILPTNSIFLLGQYVRIVGSTLNDGIYLVTDNLITLDGAKDETFTGAICGLAIPADFLYLVDEISTFQENAANNPSLGFVSSESFPNYSYTAAKDSNGNISNWMSTFQSRLNPYRKMFDEVML